MKRKFNFWGKAEEKLHLHFPLTLVLLLVLFSVIPGLKQEIIMPGVISQVESSIVVNNDNQPHELYTTAVLVVRKPSPLVSSVLSLFSKNEVREISSAEDKISNAQYKKMGQLDHTSSYQNALINGYRMAAVKNPAIKLDYQFQAMKLYYVLGSNDLEIGDEITMINNTKITKENFSDFYRVKNASLFSDRLGKNVTCERAILIPFYKINGETSFPTFSTNISSSVGGPSGGFMQTLYVYTKLIGGGRKKLKIAGTGTIELDGTVGTIGGVVQKVHTVVRNDVDIFFIPLKNFQDHQSEIERIIKNKTIKVIPIKNLQEGIEIYEKIT